MMKNIILPAIIAFQLLCLSGLVHSEDLNTHSAYKVTSYNLGDLLGLPDNNGANPAPNLNPLPITGAASDIFTSEHQRTVSLDEPASGGSSNFNSIALSAQIDATSNLSLQGVFGLTRNLWTPDLFDTVNGSSWEANLGIIYRLLNNLSYELHLGYMDPGNLFTNRGSYSDVESIIMVSNQLTLSF
jgi:hypothetical protein